VSLYDPKMPVSKHRSSANAPDNTSLSLNERILKECHELYTDEEKGTKFFPQRIQVHVGIKSWVKFFYNLYHLFSSGLVTIAKSLGLTLLAPRKKINVLLIGNHSAGKSSFINW